jgi:GNAT superfamily N-acetyltransferase
VSGGAGGDAVIRLATRDDLPALRRLWFEFETWLNAIGEPSDIDPQKFDGFAALAFGDQPLCQVLVAELGSETVGYLVYHVGVWMDDMAPALFVGDLFVSASIHRRGIGRLLMERARAIGREHGAQHLFWTVWRENAAAQDFYRRLGAEVFDEEVFMRWPVAS